MPSPRRGLAALDELAVVGQVLLDFDGGGARPRTLPSPPELVAGLGSFPEEADGEQCDEGPEDGQAGVLRSLVDAQLAVIRAPRDKKKLTESRSRS